MRHLEGQVFNKLTILKVAKSNRHKDRSWLCICECGNEVVLTTDHLTRKKNPVKSCGCWRARKGPRHKDWKGVGDISGGWWNLHVARFNTGKREKIKVTITLEQAWELFLKQDKKCAYTRLPLIFHHLGEYNSASLDRIDSAGHYSLDNVQWVHKDINFMKRTYSHEYFLSLCRKVCGL